MAGFTKLWSTIVTSTVWAEEHPTRIVWVTMLATADACGRVEASLPGLAHVARVTIEECRTAIERLSAPDKESRTQEFEGRRLIAFDGGGGWQIVNYEKYRNARNADERREYWRDYKRAVRAEQSVHKDNVDKKDKKDKSKMSIVSTHAEAEAEAEKKQYIGANGSPPSSKPDFMEALRSNPAKPAKKERKPRERTPADDLFDAIGRATGVNPLACAGEIAKARQAILAFMPGVTPAEIERRGANYRKNHPDLTIGPMALAKWWPECICAKGKDSPMTPLMR